MQIPDNSIVEIFKGSSYSLMKELNCEFLQIGGYINEPVYWLNTPGPIYTTQTDNCGTGQIEAMSNVCGDIDYYEFIFKQPENYKELMEVMSASYVDPLGGYYVDGNQYWTNERIIKWWSQIDIIIDYMVERYSEELELPSNPHNSLWDGGGGLKEVHFFGPPTPLPYNYKALLDFYKYSLIDYLKWYMQYNNGSCQKLTELNYNWIRKEQLDKKLEVFNPQRKNLLEEYLSTNTINEANSEKPTEIKIEKKTFGINLKIGGNKSK
jgi:hypothetical protein